jgi:hypothetical protein
MARTGTREEYREKVYLVRSLNQDSLNISDTRRLEEDVLA